MQQEAEVVALAVAEEKAEETEHINKTILGPSNIFPHLFSVIPVVMKGIPLVKKGRPALDANNKLFIVHDEE